MPATFGVTSNFGLTPPTGGTVEESTSEDEIEIKTIKDATGTTCRAVPSKMIKTTVTLKGRGLASIALAAGALGGTVKVISVKNTESNDDFPNYEMTGTSYATAS